MMVAGHELTPAGWRTFGAIVVCLAILAAGGIWYTSVSSAHTKRVLREADRQDDARWCELLAILIGPDTPATTERGQRIAVAIVALRERFGCP